MRGARGVVNRVRIVQLKDFLFRAKETLLGVDIDSYDV